MDKLRKIGVWIWNNKERLAFGLLAVVLTVQVYRVMSQDIKTPELPKGPAPDAYKPPEVPAAPAPPPSENYSTLYEKNPFWYFSSQPGTGESEAKAEEDNIRLLDIQATPEGGYAARIYTKAAKWYKQGESFESYQLISIDPEQQQVEVYSGKSGNTLTLRKQ